MADILGRQDQLLMGGLSSDSMFLNWPALTSITGGGLGMLIQAVGLEYRQPVRRVFEVGPGVVPINIGIATVNGSGSICDSPAAPLAACSLRTQPSYYIAGRPEGRLRLGRFIGPKVLSACFYRTYGSPCSANVLQMSGKVGCNSGAQTARRMQWTMTGVLLDMIGMDVNAQEMVVQEGLNAQFMSLDIAIEGDDGSCQDLTNPAV